MKSFCVVLALCALHFPMRGQSGFNVRLRLDFDSAEQTVRLYEGGSARGAQVAALRGNQITLATTALLARKALTPDALGTALDGARSNTITGDDVFRIREARLRSSGIKALVDQCRRHDFGQKVVDVVAQLLPDDVRISADIPVYFVAFGHQNIDAFVRRVEWHGDTPSFVGEGRGELTVVVNLSKAAGYAGPVEQQFIELLTVVGHELFHVAFGLYQDSSPAWQQFFRLHHGYADELLKLTQNEGIAYYLNLVQHYRGKLPEAWVMQVPGSFMTFNNSIHELLSPRIERQRAETLIRSSNLSAGHSESYGAFTGMIVARQIDRVFGRDALRQTIALGPFDFFGKYLDAMARDNTLPALSEEISRYVNAQR